MFFRFKWKDIFFRSYCLYDINNIKIASSNGLLENIVGESIGQLTYLKFWMSLNVSLQVKDDASTA